MNSYIIRNKKWSKIFVVTTEGPCNCFCLGCGVPRLSYQPRSTSQVIKDLEKGIESGYDTVEIIGGEPTIHPDFFYLLKKARKLYKKVYLTSNGITLADKNFAQKIISLVDNITITLYGHKASLHETWTRKKGSFKKTAEGIRNCFSLKPEAVLVTHLVWKKNFPYLREMLKFDLKLKVKRINFLNIQPVGRAKSIFGKLTVPLKKLNNFDLTFIDLIDNFQSVEIEDYPPCVFSEKIWEKTKDNIHIVDMAGQIFLDENSQINYYDLFTVHDAGFGLDSNLKTLKNIKLIDAKLKNYRRHLSACHGCRFINECNGIFNEYIKIFGQARVEREIHKIRKTKNKLIFQ